MKFFVFVIPLVFFFHIVTTQYETTKEITIEQYINYYTFLINMYPQNPANKHYLEYIQYLKQQLEWQHSTTTTTIIPDPLTNSYYAYYDLLDWYENQIAEIGPSHRNWKINMIEFGITGANYNLTGIQIKFKESQKTVFLEANIHGGEPITTGVATYVFNQLLTNSDESDSEMRRAVEKFNWLILPIANPDGYMFKLSDPFMFRKQTWKKTTCNTSSPDEEVSKVVEARAEMMERYVRKSFKNNAKKPSPVYFKRKVIPGWFIQMWFGHITTTTTTTTTTTPTTTTTLPPRPCIGINANLNFKYKFGSYGVSIDKCDQNYAGLQVETEPVTQMLAHYMIDHNKDIIMYISLHSNETRRLMIPFSNGEPCKNSNLLRDIAQKVSDFVRQKTRAKYDIGNIADLKEPSSGHSVDFARITTIKYIYMIETQDTVWHTAPPTLIPKRGKEVMLLLYDLCRNVAREESKMPDSYKSNSPSSQETKLHAEPTIFVPIVLFVIIFQICNLWFFS